MTFYSVFGNLISGESNYSTRIVNLPAPKLQHFLWETTPWVLHLSVQYFGSPQFGSIPLWFAGSRGSILILACATKQIKSQRLRISSNYATHCVGDNVLTNRPHELIFLVPKRFGGVYQDTSGPDLKLENLRLQIVKNKSPNKFPKRCGSHLTHKRNFSANSSLIRISPLLIERVFLIDWRADEL